MTLPAWAPVIAAPFVGSTVGVLVRRLPAGRPVAMARSGCEGCGHRLGPFELVPLLSFLALRGRCRACRAPIGAFHPAVELAAIVVAAWAVWVGGDPGQVWAGCVLGWALLAAGWIDLLHMRLPDAITLPLVPAGLAACLALRPEAVLDHAVGAAIGYAALRGVAIGYRRLRGRDGLGAGDAKLFAASGAWLGWEALPTVLLGAVLAGLMVALLLRLSGRAIGRGTAIPFGPGLALATWLVWLYGVPAGLG